MRGTLGTQVGGQAPECLFRFRSDHGRNPLPAWRIRRLGPSAVHPKPCGRDRLTALFYAAEHDLGQGLVTQHSSIGRILLASWHFGWRAGTLRSRLCLVLGPMVGERALENKNSAKKMPKKNSPIGTCVGSSPDRNFDPTSHPIRLATTRSLLHHCPGRDGVYPI
jgi:hypothetical protein